MSSALEGRVLGAATGSPALTTALLMRQARDEGTATRLLSVRERDFVLAARTVGTKKWQIAVWHLLPNAIAPVIVAVTIGIPVAIFAESGLSFLGLGVNDPIPSWGQMVGSAMSYVRVYWYLGVFPTLAIAITMLGFTFVGDGMRDAFDAASER